MKTHIVLSPANIEIEYRLAGAGSRLAAFVIDFFIQIIIIAFISFGVLFGIFGYRFGTLANVAGFALGFLIISWFVVYFCYFIVLEQMMNGQSIGKKLFGLRVICDNGQPVGLAQSMIRNLFKSVLDIFYIGLFFIMFSPKHKRIGDIVAGTVVVAEHYGNAGIPLRPSLALSENNNAGAMSTDEGITLRLSNEEKELLHMYFARKAQFSEEGRILQNRWAAYFSWKWQIDASLINDEMLSALLQKNEGFEVWKNGY